MKKLAFDTETHRIGPGAIAPPLVCLSLATEVNGKEETLLVSNGDGDSLRARAAELFEPGHLLIGHNTAFDLAVLVTAFPDLECAVWDKLEAGEVTCTMIREQLLNLSTSGKLDFMELPDGSREKLNYKMDTLVKQYFGVDISADKDDEDAWRTNYELLDGTPSDKFPPDARSYAIDDARWTFGIYQQQAERVKSKAGYASLSTEGLNAAAHFALFLMTVRGMAVDPQEFAKVQKMLDEELAPEKLALLIEAGIMRAGSPEQPYAKQLKKAEALLKGWVEDGTLSPDTFGHEWDDIEIRCMLEEEGIKFKKAVKASIDKKKLTAKIMELCAEHGLTVKRTPKGGVSADNEVIADLSMHCDVIAQYEARQKLQKLVTTELPRMTWDGEVAEAVHFNFRPLLETGRTSSFASNLYPSGNGQQIDPRVRPCYVARPGFLFASVDYSTLELVTTAQVTYDLFGESVHRDKINAGVDLHSYLGSQLALHLHVDFRALMQERGIQDDANAVYDAFRSCKGHEDSAVADFFAFYRKFAKPVGLGYPGGLGPITFLALAKKTYGVDTTEIASSMDDSEFIVTKQLLFYAKKLFGVDEGHFQWTAQLKAIALALKLRDIWMCTYPEMPLYFKHVSDNCGDEHNTVLGVSTVSGKDIKGLCYTSPMGMHRAGATFTAVANGMCMQTPSAEGAKIACIMVTRECRDESKGSVLLGSHPVDFVHDEIIVEVPEEKAHECAMRMCEVMEEAMACVVSDVKVGTEAALMRRWYKQAEPVFMNTELGGHHKLVPWEPKE